jgi:hypothetical protein
VTRTLPFPMNSSIAACHSGVVLCTLCMTANGRDSVHVQYGTVRCI